MDLESGRMEQLLGELWRSHPRTAAATVAGGETAIASTGVPLEADFEIGSVSKAITGLLYRKGRRQDPWVGEALGPAGGIRSTVTDMAALAQALLAGSAPGLSALDPVASFAGPAARIGAGWMTLDGKGRR